MSRSPDAICGSGPLQRQKAGSVIGGLLDEGDPKGSSRIPELRFPVRIRIGIPPEGLGSRLDQMNACLDANCGADGWTSTPASTRGIVNDALAVYFLDATIASAFVARWCAAQRIEIVDGVYRVRDDEPKSRVGASLHKTP